MKYRITITEIKTVTEKDSNWEKLYDAETFEKAKAKDPDVEQYGYRQIDKEVEKDFPIYNQTRETEIDLKSIIDAFNK